MQTYPITDPAGMMFAVEVENAYIRPRRLAEILRGVDAVSAVRVRRRFSVSSDVHVTFQYHGKPFIVLEPYGDSSRYWIGPDNAETDKMDVRPIEEALRRYRLSTVSKIIGGLLTLRFTSVFHR